MKQTSGRRFNNPICKECITKNIAKYGSFECNCEGITVEDYVKEAIKDGYSEHEARWMFDPVYFFETVYGHKARWYQPRILLCTSKNMVGRQCRQTGKTLMFMYKIFHFTQTNKNKTVLVITPQEAQIKKIWDEYIFRDYVEKCPDIKASVAGSSMSPYYQIKFDNGSKIILMIAGPGARSQTSDWIYMDEAAMIPTEELNSIFGTMLSRGDEATVLMTSTPLGRGNKFYEACKEDSEFNEYHVAIDDVEEMRGQKARLLKLFGDTGYYQECLAEFPDTTGGPFNYRGIDLSKMDYEYEDFKGPEAGWMYFGGADWNGPNIGTYFYIVGFNPSSLNFKVVDKQVIASATWNSIRAKDTFIALNRKWRPTNWLCDSGYGHSIMEELKYWSTYELPDNLPGNHPDALVKEILEPVAFGDWIEIKDPFNGGDIKKTQKSFVVSQVSRLFEVQDNSWVPIAISKHDAELVKCLENYKLVGITDKGTEKYGFNKKDGIEDHAIDAFMLAIYGVKKHYSELFNRVFFASVPIEARDIMTPKKDDGEVKNIPYGSSIVLITDNSPEPIMLDESAWKEPSEENNSFITRTFNKSMIPSRNKDFTTAMNKRNSSIVRRKFDI